MSILTKDEIIKQINAGNIEIKPFDRSQVGPASIDLRLGNEFSTFKRTYRNIIVDEQASAEKEVLEHTSVRNGDHFLLLPHETVIAVTRERVKLSPSLCGQLEGRGRFARLGLSVHIAAGFIQPGIADSQIFFAITNVGPVALELYPGTTICQLIIHRTIGESTYEGRYKGYKSVK